LAARGFTIYGGFIGEQISLENEQKKSIESRGLAVVTTSGALATLLLGFATFAGRRSSGHLALPPATHGWIKWALIFFTIAALGAILTNIPVWLAMADEGSLQALVEESWEDDEITAQKEIALVQVQILKNARKWNDRKGKVLFGAMLFEFFAVGCIARAVWLAL
jgi:hypothetical protein